MKKVKNKVLQEITQLNDIVLSEQVKDDSFIKLAKGVNIEKLTEGDDNPMFVTLEIIHEGVSKNRVNYTRKDIKELYKQILERKPNAYQGHLTEEERSSKNPDSKTIWVGAGLKEVDGKLTLWGKGYVLPEEKKFRGYLKRAVAAGKRVPVSIYAKSRQLFNKIKGVYNIVSFDLESIDWARDFAEGVPSLTGKVMLTAEMQDFNLITNNEMDLSELTIDQLKNERPDLVDELSKSDKVLSEMATSLNVETEVLAETVQKQAQELEATSETLAEMKQEKANMILESVLQEQISDKTVRSVVSHVIEAKLDTVVSEMVQSEKNLDKTKLEEVVISEMKTPEIKALLRSKEDNSVPPAVANNNTNTEGSMTKVVKYKG